MVSHFFIDRPIFATVLSIVITLAGGIAVFSLPVAQYPPISPPQVQVAINYPGASAQVVADTVAAPIEQQVNGVPGMLYMTSLSGNNGTYVLFVTFAVGVNLDTALVMVQNRVQLAMPLLPTSVQKQGITIRKKTPDILMVISLYSPDDRYDGLYLSNFATINLYDPLLRVEGVSDINIFGVPEYSIRAWLDPQELASRGMNASDVATAVADQNLPVASGRVGQPPSGRQQASDLPVDTLGWLTSPEQFGDIIVKVSNPVPISPAARRPPVVVGAMSDSSAAHPLRVVPRIGTSVRISGFRGPMGAVTSMSTTGGMTSTGRASGATGSESFSGGAMTGGGAMLRVAGRRPAGPRAAVVRHPAAARRPWT